MQCVDRIESLSTESVIAEIEQLSRFYQASPSATQEVCAWLRPFLKDYAEFALSEDGFQLISGGQGTAAAEGLADAAAQYGASRESLEVFRYLAQRYPHSHLGIKFSVGISTTRPSLYIRTVTDKAPLLAELRAWCGKKAVDELASRIAECETLYGLGTFTAVDGKLGVKTYSLAVLPPFAPDADGEFLPASRLGFRSWRLASGRLQQEYKEYLPEFPLQPFPLTGERWRQILSFARQEMGFQIASHCGILHRDDGSRRVKLYFERVGAIPTDYGAL